MDRYIEHRGEDAWIANPVNPAENFADKWAEEPKKRENFYIWLEQARQDFALYLRAHRFDDVPEVLRKSLGAGLVNRVLNANIPAVVSGLAVPTTVKRTVGGQDIQRAEAAINEIQRTGTQSKPWAKL